MTKRQQIVKTISKNPLEKMRVITTKSRPEEKSNKILITRIKGQDWYCERPTYFFSKFDRSFLEKGFLEEQEILFPKDKEILTVFDERGLFWSHYKISSFGLVEYFLKNPSAYLSAMAKHEDDIGQIVDGLKKIKPKINNNEFLEDNLLEFVKLYNLFYRFLATIYMTFDELAWQFRQFLHCHLPKEIANAYFTNFLGGEMTKEALKLGYVKERGMLEWSKTRGVLYGMDLPSRLFYKPPKFFTEYSDDIKIISCLVKKGISNDELHKFFAFRAIVPLGFQINEESQYFETSMLSAHLGILAKKAAKKLNKSIDDLQSLSVNQIVNLL